MDGNNPQNLTTLRRKRNKLNPAEEEQRVKELQNVENERLENQIDEIKKMIEKGNKKHLWDNVKYNINELPSKLMPCGELMKSLYCMSEFVVFKEEVSSSAYPDYRAIIEKPMWLDKIRDNLFNNQYKRTRSFYKDLK
eukprot:UN33984